MLQITKYTVYLTLFIILLSLWVFYVAIRPFRIISHETPEQFGAIYERISFKTADNIVIRGWFIPNKDPHAKTIILLHGYPADKGDILPSRIFLHSKYNLLFIDFRYLGESEGRYSTLGKMEVEDLRAAIAYLHTRNIHEVGVWGCSLGAAVAILAAPQSPEIKAIVAESPFARLGMMADAHYPIPGVNLIIGKLLKWYGWWFFSIDVEQIAPVDALKNIRIPVLMLFNEKDTLVGYQHAELMIEATKNKPNVSVIVTKDLGHGAPMANYQNIVADFFRKNL